MAVLVLIVDDDTDMLEMLATSLRGHGLEVVSAPDAETAYAMAHGYLPDAVLLDVAMPRIDGFELLEHWRSAGITTPVVMYTAHDEPSLRTRAVRAGAQGFLTKPTPAEEIAGCLFAAAGGPTLREN